MSLKSRAFLKLDDVIYLLYGRPFKFFLQNSTSPGQLSLKQDLKSSQMLSIKNSILALMAVWLHLSMLDINYKKFIRLTLQKV